MKNNYGEIDIMDNVAIDTFEYNSYEEAVATAEMLSLQNVKVQEHGGKYRLVPYTGAMDFSGTHLAVGDKVHYGLFRTWEITEIDRTSNERMHVTIKSGDHQVMISKYEDEPWQCEFRSLKLGKVNGEYILVSIKNFLSDNFAELYLFTIFGVIPLPGFIYCILKLMHIV